MTQPKPAKTKLKAEKLLICCVWNAEQPFWYRHNMRYIQLKISTTTYGFGSRFDVIFCGIYWNTHQVRLSLLKLVVSCSANNDFASVVHSSSVQPWQRHEQRTGTAVKHSSSYRQVRLHLTLSQPSAVIWSLFLDRTGKSTSYGFRSLHTLVSGQI